MVTEAPPGDSEYERLASADDETLLRLLYGYTDEVPEDMSAVASESLVTLILRDRGYDFVETDGDGYSFELYDPDGKRVRRENV